MQPEFVDFFNLSVPKRHFFFPKTHLLIVEKLRRVRYQVSADWQEDVTQQRCRDLQTAPRKALANLPA